MKYIVKVSDKSPMFDWRGWWFLAPMQGLTDIEHKAYVYTERELNDSLYMADNIKHGMFELKKVNC